MNDQCEDTRSELDERMRNPTVHESQVAFFEEARRVYESQRNNMGE